MNFFTGVALKTCAIIKIYVLKEIKEMKKNLGSAFVKKSITVAMAFMLIATTPAATVFAAENTTQITTETTTEKTDVEIKAEQEASEILNQVTTELDQKLNAIDTNKHANELIDEASKIVDEVADKTIENTVANAEESAKDSVTKTENAKDTDASVKNYDKDLDKVINDDSSIVKNDVVDKITFDSDNNKADILITVKDADDKDIQTSLSDYTEKKAEEAQAAADKAEEIAKDVTSSTNIEESRKELAAAKEQAQAAADDAHTAYDAAVSALDKEIAVYNAYVAQYYSAEEAAKLMKKDSSGATPQLTLDELKDYLSREQLDNNLDSLSKNDLKDQAAKIGTAQIVVKNCQEAVEHIQKNTIEPLNKLDETFVTNLESMKAQTEEAIKALEATGEIGTEAYYALNNALDEINNNLKAYEDSHTTTVDEQKVIDGFKDFVKNTQDSLNSAGVSGALKDMIQSIQDTANSILNWYTKEDFQPEYTGNEHGDTAQNIVNHATDTINQMKEQFDGLLDNAQDKVTEAQDTYDKAYDEYIKLKNQYDGFSLASLDSKFAALKAKLEAAEAEVVNAKANLELANAELAEVIKAQDNFEEAVKNLDKTIDDATTTTPSTSTDSSSSATTTITVAPVPAAAGITTITDEDTALADTITIDDEATPLDNVPTTGDSLPAAAPIAATGALAMAGAFVANLKRRFGR